MYTVRLYLRTGFNAVNIPDSPALLEGGAFEWYNAPAIDIIQPYLLVYVSIRMPYATNAPVKYADYCRISSANEASWYAVDGYKYTSSDVCTLRLIPDMLNTAGGVGAITFSDGVAVRSHVDEALDWYGSYIEPDELLTPAYPLSVSGTWMYRKNSTQTTTLVESTLDPVAMAATNRGATFDDGLGNEVTVPLVQSIDTPTSITLRDGYNASNTYQTPGSAMYVRSSSIMSGVDKMRSLGVENAVTAQYMIPLSMCDIQQDTDGKVTRLGSQWKNAILSSVEDADIVNPLLKYARLEPIAGQPVHNMRLQYSEYTPYRILTAAGNVAEYAPYEIWEGSDTVDTYPHLTMNTDPRPTGRPYFRFQAWKRNAGSEASGDDEMPFFMNSVAGEQWAQVPLVFSEKSGTWAERQNFRTRSQIVNQALQSAELNQAMGVLSLTGRVGSLDPAASGVQNALSGLTGSLGIQPTSGLGGLLGVAGQIATGIAGAVKATEWDMPALAREYGMRQRMELTSFATTQAFVTPEIHFPLDPKLIRDVYGNGCFVYRVCYDARDYYRIDRLLTMYGYKYTHALSSADFATRSLFNYVRAQGVHVSTSSIPMWMRDGIAAQLEGGVRVWHVKPDPVTAYAYNPTQGG